MVEAVESLMGKGQDHLSSDESALVETLAILIQAYDDRRHPLPNVLPSEMLEYLIETSGKTSGDLIERIWNSRTNLRGSERQNVPLARRKPQHLATVFHVSAELLI